MQRHQFDGDIGNGGGIGRKASAEAIEIGQSAGIEFGLDDLPSSASQARSWASANSPTMVRHARFSPSLANSASKARR